MDVLLYGGLQLRDLHDEKEEHDGAHLHGGHYPNHERNGRRGQQQHVYARCRGVYPGDVALCVGESHVELYDELR